MASTVQLADAATPSWRDVSLFSNGTVAPPGTPSSAEVFVVPAAQLRAWYESAGAAGKLFTISRECARGGPAGGTFVSTTVCDVAAAMMGNACMCLSAAHSTEHLSVTRRRTRVADDGGSSWAAAGGGRADMRVLWPRRAGTRCVVRPHVSFGAVMAAAAAPVVAVGEAACWEVSSMLSPATAMHRGRSTLRVDAAAAKAVERVQAAVVLVCKSKTRWSPVKVSADGRDAAAAANAAVKRRRPLFKEAEPPAPPTAWDATRRGERRDPEQPKPPVALHICGMVGCINPMHLWQGSRSLDGIHRVVHRMHVRAAECATVAALVAAL